MRAGIVVLVGMLAACEVNNGLYFEVSGESAGIAFDELEFFLAKDAGGMTPFTPDRPYLDNTTLPGVERQRLFKRLFSASDIQQTTRTKSLTYYLAPDPANTYPRYLLVVASRDGDVVGLGEVEAFKVQDDGVYVYPVALEPVDGGYERWGAPLLDAGTKAKGEDCVRWTRQRPGEDEISTYAVIRESNHDCDLAPSSADCDDLNYCADANGVGCFRRELPCIDSNSCDIGSCTDGRPGTNGGMKECKGQTCLPEFMCGQGGSGAGCEDKELVPDFLACAVDLSTVHTEVLMPTTRLGGELCEHTFTVPSPSGLRCRQPQILWPPNGMVGNGFTFVVDNATGLPDACTYNFTGPMPNSIPPANSHLIVSVGHPMQASLRTSFVIGFQPQTEAIFSCLNTVTSIKYPTPMQPPPMCP